MRAVHCCASLAILLAATEAAAQASVELFQVAGLNALTGDQGFNRASCQTTGPVRLDLRLGGLTEPAYVVRFVQYDVGGPRAPCPTDMLEPVRAVIVDQTAVAPTGGQLTFLRDLSISELLGDDACVADEAGVRRNVNLCFQLTVLPNDTNAVLVGGIGLDYDTELPPALSLDDLTVDSGITRIRFSPTLPEGTAETLTTVVQYRACPVAAEGEGEGEGEGEEEQPTEPDPNSLCGAAGLFTELRSESDGVVSVEGLAAGQQVEARLFFRDDFDNEGSATPITLFQAAGVTGPLGLYDGAGSQVSCTPNCTDTGTSTTSAGGLGGLLWFLSRRGRRAMSRLARWGRGAAGGSSSLASLVVILLAGLAAGGARAETGQVTVGIGVSPYTPALDDELVAGEKIFPVYSCLFADKSLLELAGDVDTHVFDGFGSLQLSLGFNVVQAQGKAQPSSSNGARACGEPMDIDVQLSMARVRPGLTYRFDPLLDAWSVPLVPYARAALIAQGYLFTADGDFDRGAKDPVGLRFGWEASAGLMLALDFLDSIDPFVPDTTRRARANGVFNHSFLFAEGAYQVVDDFGQPGFIFSPRDDFLGTGLPILWKLGVAVELL